MGKKHVVTEYRAMQLPDLSQELRHASLELKKTRIGVMLGKQKNTGKLREQRHKVARLQTVFNEKQKALKSSASDSTLPAPKAASSSL